ncbi:uncharacterized protein [Nicotiana tomentosiformis]|uniref:Protein RTF2 homolog n=1 Tax=Nicotiana tabacum TaxID=4097 RepID=A0A1S4CWM8_TOBAC|nr:replication termination factor 2-like [Nicotiana tomentosiformis]XP_016505542.1 PREDICTED: protein RTF2 homolog [Nicotiana tabacum]
MDKIQKSLGSIKDNSIYFTFNGQSTKDSTLLNGSGISPFSTLVLRLRLRGGGGDGGATKAESRDCYLKIYVTKKLDKIDSNEIRLSKWLNCALSNEPLKHHVVVDKLGYIKGSKDMILVELSVIRGKEDRGVGDGEGTGFQCSITGLEFNEKYNFFALRGCGHVLSAKALKEVKSSGCLVCYKEFVESDNLVINGSEEEVAALRDRMKDERVKLKDNTKVEKGKNEDVVVNDE